MHKLLPLILLCGCTVTQPVLLRSADLREAVNNYMTVHRPDYPKINSIGQAWAPDNSTDGYYVTIDQIDLSVFKISYENKIKNNLGDREILEDYIVYHDRTKWVIKYLGRDVYRVKEITESGVYMETLEDYDSADEPLGLDDLATCRKLLSLAIDHDPKFPGAAGKCIVWNMSDEESCENRNVINKLTEGFDKLKKHDQAAFGCYYISFSRLNDFLYYLIADESGICGNYTFYFIDGQWFVSGSAY